MSGMRPVITAETSGALDAASSVAVEVLMDRAGYAVAGAVADMGFRYGSKCVVLVGPGNNGGDGYVAATYLVQRGAAVTVLAWRDPASPSCQWAARRAHAAGVMVRPWSAQPLRADVIVDALFGGGFHGVLPQDVVPWLAHPAPVVAVDVPSGLSATTGQADGPTFAATLTVTFHAAKTGHYIGVGPGLTGRVEVVDIGLTGGDPAFTICEEGDAPTPQRTWDAHKWSVGSVMVVGGVAGLTGAALMSAKSALRFGAGAVALASLAVSQPMYAVAGPEILTVRVGSGDRYQLPDADRLISEANRFDVLALGSGLGPGQEEFVARVAAEWTGKLLLDADALLPGSMAFADRPGETIITPHAGEFQRMTGQPASYSAAARVAEEAGLTVVLKGWPTFVAHRDGTVAVTSGGRQLATIGTGDVLAGMISALWARGLAGPVAARSAAYWHGRTAAAAAESKLLTADRLVDHVGSLPV